MTSSHFRLKSGRAVPEYSQLYDAPDSLSRHQSDASDYDVGLRSRRTLSSPFAGTDEDSSGSFSTCQGRRRRVRIAPDSGRIAAHSEPTLRAISDMSSL